MMCICLKTCSEKKTFIEEGLVQRILNYDRAQ